MAHSKLTPASFVDIAKQTASSFGEDRIYRHAAALAYFTVFSLSPMIVVLISALAIYFGDAARAGDAIKYQIEQAIGSAAVAEAIQGMVKSATSHGADTARPIYATIIALGVALWGASGLFGALQDSLNTIWGVMPKPTEGVMNFIRTRFVSFAMVLGIGFLLLVSLVLSTVFTALTHLASGITGESVVLAWVLNFALGLIVSSLLFAAIFKVLPDADLQWRDVGVGALVTGLLFSLGRLALGLYLGRAGAASTYGSAGALVILLLWVNYAATILFIGAEFTKAYANVLGSKIRPSEHAIAVDSPEALAAGIKSGPSSPAAIVSDSPSKASASKGASAKGASASGATSNGARGAVVVKTELAPEKRAELERGRKLDFEHTLSVVAGAAVVVMWVLRKRSRSE
jgi:membrane protein